MGSAWYVSIPKRLPASKRLINGVAFADILGLLNK